MLFYRIPVLSPEEKGKLAQIYLLRRENASGEEKELLDLKLEVIRKNLWDSVKTEDEGFSVKKYSHNRRSFTNNRTDLAEIFRILVQLDPNDSRLPAMMRFIQSNAEEEGCYLSSYYERVKFLALADYLTHVPQNTIELQKTLQIGQKEVPVTIKDFEGEKISFELSEVLDKNNGIRLSSNVGDEESYFLNYHIRYFVDDIADMKSVENGIKIKRMITDNEGEEIKNFKKAAVGDIFSIELQIENITSVTHVAITDALAANLEFVDIPSSVPKFEHVDFRDDRLDAFLQQGVKEASIHYQVRVISEGSYHWPPAEGYAMYQPDISGASQGQLLTISASE
jgi:uncharacterized protein YfaS (alpha-2-macroglobulin family)